MKKYFLLIVLGMTVLSFSSNAEATITRYDGNETGWETDSSIYVNTLINFDDLSLGDIINTQYSPIVEFSRRESMNIIAKEDCHGTLARSSPYCAHIEFDPDSYSNFILNFPQPVFGVSFYVGDLDFPRIVNVSVYNSASELLISYDISRSGDWTHVALLSDSQDVSQIVVVNSDKTDGNGFDDLTVASAPPTLDIDLDIKPGSCPNPINVKSKGLIPVAILGTYDFDVNEIDIASISLLGVAPIKSSFEDVATPFEAFNEEQDAYDCNDYGPDEYMDLTLKFKTQEIIDALSDVNDGDVLVLELTGESYDGIQINGEDVVVIKKKGKN